MNIKWFPFLFGLTFAFFASANYAQLGPMAIDFPVFQENAPLVVIAVAGSVSKLDMANEVDLLNVSDKTIVGYQLGWVISGGNQAGRGVPFYGMRFDANLKPGEALTSSGQGASFSMVQTTRSLNHWSSALIVIGVVYVKFEDGSEWVYPLSIKRSFPEKDDPTLHQRVDPVVKSLIERKRAQHHAGQTQLKQGKAGCASAKGFLTSFIDAVFSWIEPTPLYAGCVPCWFVVCNPAFRQCNNNDPDSGLCFNTPCELDGPCNYARCAYIPSCTPDCS